MSTSANQKPRVGISSCIIGDTVRYNGQHASSDWGRKVLSNHFQWIPVCPEVGAGMGIPRETVRVVKENGALRIKGSRSANDHTKAFDSFVKAFLLGFKAQNPHGFLLKSKSPSCGMTRIPVYDNAGKKVEKARGLFAQALMAEMPMLPVEEDGRLNDAALRANFIERVYAYQAFSTEVEVEPSVAKLITFHSDHKLALMARDPNKAKVLGQLVAKAKKATIQQDVLNYASQFSEIMKRLPSVGRHANVMEHLMGYVKHKLNSDEKRELIRLIRQFQQFLVPLSVPLTLLRHHLKKASHPWVTNQSYLKTYPGDFLMHQMISQGRP